MVFKESETLELKKSTSELKEAIISICAILNKHGKGMLYFGIEDDGKVIGQQVGKSTLKDISKSITDHVDPKIFPDIFVKNLEGKDCIVVEFRGHDGLYSAFGRFYLRAGEENKRLSTREIGHLIEKHKNYIYSWGAEVSDKSISSVKLSAVKAFVKKGRDAGRIDFPFDSVKNVLSKLHLVKGHKLLNAGCALFCKENHFEVQAAVFASKDKVTFLDIQSFHGNLVELIEKSEVYVKEHINWRADIVEFKRVETPEVPIKAVREAIINSLCHRDFTNPKSNEVAIYKDRIEIFNPGQFPHEYSPEDFIKGNLPSLPRNPLVAEALYLSEDIEKWGSGLRRISEECRAAKVKVSFTKIKSGFVVTFYRTGINAVKGIADKDNLKTVEKTVEKMLGLIAASPRITQQELVNKTGLTRRGVEWNLKKLKADGIIRRIGPDKGGHWEIISKM